jgi:hypothetical protein
VLASGSRHVCELRESETPLGENRNGLRAGGDARSRLPPARHPDTAARRRPRPRSPGNVAAAGTGVREVAANAPIAVAIGGGSERARGNGREGREGGVMGAVTDTVEWRVLYRLWEFQRSPFGVLLSRHWCGDLRRMISLHFIEHRVIMKRSYLISSLFIYLLHPKKNVSCF